MHDLALAFDIKVKRDGTKEEVLPALIAAESEGRFRGEPKRPEYLVKASRSADEPFVDWESHKLELRGLSFRELQKLAADNEINSFGKGKDELQRELEAARII